MTTNEKSVSVFNPIFRNFPLNHVHRIHAWAVAMSSGEESRTRLDSTYVIGESSRGLGIVGRGHYVKRKDDGDTILRLPIMERWMSDFQYPALERELDSDGDLKMVVTPFGVTSRLDGVPEWIGRMFGGTITQDIHRCLDATKMKVKGDIRIHMMSCGGIRADQMTSYIVEAAKEIMDGKASIMQNGKQVDCPKDFMLQQMFWHVYGRPLFPYMTKTPDEAKQERELYSKSKLFLHLMHELEELTN